MSNDYYIEEDTDLQDAAYHQHELEQQERLLTDPEFRKSYETWLDSLPSNQKEEM